MFTSRPEKRRAPSARLRPARAAFIAATALTALAFPAASLAAAGDVELTGVFAKPVDASPYASPQANENNLCTPEPNGRRIYGTEAEFNPDTTMSYKTSGYPASVSQGYDKSSTFTAAPNFTSRDELVPALQAGAVNDLCFGFTLTPNVDPTWIKSPTGPGNAQRIQDDPPVPDTPATHVGFDGDGKAIDNDDLKTASIDMPAGFSGTPDGSPTCSDSEFLLDRFIKVPASCDDAVVGTAFVRVSTVQNSSGSLKAFLAVGGSPNKSTGLDGGIVYNLDHGPNELGKLGVSLQPVASLAPAKFVVRLQLAPDGSGRVRTVVEEAPRRLYQNTSVETDGTLKADAKAFPLYVESVGIRAWGSKAEHPTLSQDFAEWGTNCTDAISANASIETYLGKKSSMSSDPIKLTGCDQLPFLPSISVETAERRPAVPTATTIKVGLGQTTSGLKAALLRDVKVTLPTGLELGAQVGSGPNGLPLCSSANFGFGQQDKASTCPAGSKVGTVDIATPLLTRHFVGSVYLGEQPAVGELPALYLEATPTGATADDAPRIKLKGAVSVDADGKITTSFKDNPQLRFNELRLDFPGGDNALFTTPRQCGTTKGSSEFVSWASSVPVNVESSLTIDQDCDTPAFTPSLAMSAADQTVGASSPTTVTLTRPDRSPWLKDFKVSLPSGFLANLNIVSECPAAQAAAGACPASSRIGSVVTTAGVGSAPLTLAGEMFFTERVSGSVAGAVIVVRAKIGELDLGDVVVPARIDLRPTDAGLVLTASAPTRFKGLALNLRSFAVNLDRAGFPLNPTACGPLGATAELVGDGGQTAAPTASITYTGCTALPLAPKITPVLTGDLKANGHPEVNVTVETRQGDSNLKSTTVLLPAGVASDPKNLQNLCPAASFETGACAPISKVGTVAVNVSITSETIPGDIYLVKVVGEALPGLGLNITGRYAQRVLSKVRIDQKTGRLITAFEAIPDLPITKLALKIDGGAKSPIVVSGKLCASPSAWEANFGGQGGQSSTVKTPFDCSSPVPTIKWSRKAGLSFVVKAATGKTLKSTKLTLPKGFKLSTTKSGKKAIKVSVKGGKSKTKLSKTSVSVTAKGAGPTQITITVKPKGLVLPKTKAYKKGLKKKTKLKISQRTVTSDGNIAKATSTVKVG